MGRIRLAIGTGRTLAVAALAIAAAQAGTAGLLLSSRASGTDSALVGLPLDDGWIHLVYARNLAGRGELAYNPGEPEVGTTSPLWVGVLAPAALLGGRAPAIAAKLASAALAVLTCLLAAALACELARSPAPARPEAGKPRRGAGRTGGREAPLQAELAGLVAGLAVALDPAMAFSAASGMEVPLAAALGLSVLLALRRRRLVLAGALAGLATLARPELAVLLVLAVAWVAALVRRGEARLGRSLAGLALAAALVLPFVLYCHEVTGRPLPNTFYVKGALAPLPLEGLELLARGVLWPSLVVGFGGGALLCLLGLRHLVRRLGPDGLAVAAAPFLLAAGVVATRALPAAEAQSYYFTRYLHPVLPMLAVALGLGTAALARRGRPRRTRRAALGLGALALLLALGSAASGLPRAAERFSWSTRNIEEMQVAAGLWIAENTAPDAVVAASDAGAVRYFGERRVIDLMALNYHPAVEARRAGHLPLGTIMRTERPTHLAVLPSWFPMLEGSGAVRTVFEARASRYVVAAAPQDRFVVYEVLSAARSSAR